MIEIAPGLCAGIAPRLTKTAAVHLQLDVECDGHTNSVWLDEQQMDALQSTLLNAINAAQIVRGEREKHRKGRQWPARAR